MKKTMTKDEAWEWLKDKYVPVSSMDEANSAAAIFKKCGFHLKGHLLLFDGQNYMREWSIYPGQFGTFRSPGEREELDMHDLLAIEIVEEPDHRSLLEEAVKLLEFIKPGLHKGSTYLYQVEQFLKANRP